MAWWVPVLTALGINAGKNILTGKNITDNAIQAGVTGGILGNFSPTSSGAEVSGVGGSTGGVAGVGTVPSAAGAGGGISSSGIVPGSLESEGLLKFNSATGTYLNPSQYVGESIGMPTFTGGEGLLSNAASEAGSMLGNLAPENLSGVASLLDGQQNTSGYQQMAGTGGGGVSRGNANNLAVQFPQAKVSKRRKA
jgi:hypothetical protein